MSTNPVFTTIMAAMTAINSINPNASADAVLAALSAAVSVVLRGHAAPIEAQPQPQAHHEESYEPESIAEPEPEPEAAPVPLPEPQQLPRAIDEHPVSDAESQPPKRSRQALSSDDETSSGEEEQAAAPAPAPARALNTDYYWTDKEKRDFDDGFEQFGRDYKRIADMVGTRTEIQVRNRVYNLRTLYVAGIQTKETFGLHELMLMGKWIAAKYYPRAVVDQWADEGFIRKHIWEPWVAECGSEEKATKTPFRIEPRQYKAVTIRSMRIIPWTSWNVARRDLVAGKYDA